MYNIWNCVTILRSFLVIWISWILYVTASLYIYMYTRRISISSASITCLSIFMALSSLPISLGWVCFPCLFNLLNLKPCRLYPHVDCLESGQIPNCSGQNPVLRVHDYTTNSNCIQWILAIISLVGSWNTILSPLTHSITILFGKTSQFIMVVSPFFFQLVSVKSLWCSLGFSIFLWFSYDFPMIFLFDPHGFSPISQGLASAWDVPLILRILQMLWIPQRRHEWYSSTDTSTYLLLIHVYIYIYIYLGKL